MIPVGALAYLSSPGLIPLWTEVHRRLTRSGRVAVGRLVLRGLDDVQRESLSELLNRVVAGDRVTVDLSDLDRRLWNSAAATGLLGVVETIVGPVPDRRAEAEAEQTRRAFLRERANAALTAAGLGGCPWTAEWLDGLWRSGVTARLTSEEIRRTIGQAANALGLTVGAHGRAWSRGELAQVVTGTAHGLDDDTPLTRLVFRGLALALNGTPDYPSGAEERRALWDAAGVAGDTVATTVLTYGLRPVNEDWLQFRANLAAETHLTLREIRRLSPLRLEPQTVYVCENPRVLEAAADARAGVAMVCTMGNPTTVTHALLETLTASPSVELAYHGDFDWPGIAIAERIIGRYGAKPWRFGAGDYLRAVTRAKERGTPGQPLAGRPVIPSWDPLLAGAMTAQNVAVHEEAVIDDLLLELGIPE
jgi:uncharacterized protein (TIGR02679 family)